VLSAIRWTVSSTKRFHCTTVLCFFLGTISIFLKPKNKKQKQKKTVNEAKRMGGNLGNTHKPGQENAASKEKKQI